jgi:hypothetical protein
MELRASVGLAQRRRRAGHDDEARALMTAALAPFADVRIATADVTTARELLADLER